MDISRGTKADVVGLLLLFLFTVTVVSWRILFVVCVCVKRDGTAAFRR